MKSKNSIISNVFGILNSKSINLMDWVMAVAFLAFAVYGIFFTATTTWHYLSLGAGLAGVYMAIKPPSKAIEKALKSSVIKK